jgi:hypothetical protein
MSTHHLVVAPNNAIALRVLRSRPEPTSVIGHPELAKKDALNALRPLHEPIDPNIFPREVAN